MSRAGPPGRAVVRGIAVVLLGFTCGAAQTRLPTDETNTAEAFHGSGFAVTAVMWTQARGQNRSPSYVGDRDLIVPPALVMRRGESLDRFAADLTALRGKADANRAFVEREDPSPDEDESD